MYQLVSAIGKLKAQAGRWTSLTVANMTMVQLYQNYDKVIVNLVNNFTPNITVSLDLDEIKSTYVASGLTFSQFLTANSNTVLPTQNKSYSLDTKQCLYSDARRARYKVTPVDPNGFIDSPTLMSDREWLCLQKEGIDYNLFHESCLVTVNGMIHLTDTDGEKIYVIDGAKSSKICLNNQVGITSFREVGKMEFLPITEAMIHRRYADVPLNRNMYIDIGTPKPNKIAALVLGGYLHILDESTFYRISDSIFCIDFQNYPLLDRFYESRKYIDLSSLGLDVKPGNEWLVNVPELYSDAVLTKYATLSQSFLVFFDAESLFVEREAVRRSNLPGMFTSYIEPSLPLITGCGAITDYWRVKEDGQWALTVCEGWTDNHLYHTTNENNLVNVMDSRDPIYPVDIGRAHFLRIGTDIRVITGA